MDTLIIILAFLALAVSVAAATEIRERRRRRQADTGSAAGNIPAPTTGSPDDSGCCGRHAVCEKNSLLSSKPEIVYYEDEELDALAGIDAANYTDEQINLITEVFRTLREEEVAGWLRSLQLRNIALPAAVMEEALMIVADRRATTA